MKLSILIPTTPDRLIFIESLGKQFRSQIGEFTRDIIAEIDHFKIWVDTYRSSGLFDDTEVIYFQDNKQKTIGYKRNELLNIADGEYISFVDSDDRIGDRYFSHLFEGMLKGVDCCSLTGEITEDGKNPLLFQHSIRHNAYKTNEPSNPIRYFRFPNHLNCIKASIAKQFKFPEKNHGEDTDWATQIFKSGLIKTEHWIEDVIYYYDYRTRK